MNKKNEFKSITIHFVGIGGIGMSGIAELMLDLGYQIQGSDININSNIKRLMMRGIKFFKGHDKNNIKNISALVFSSAIKKNNPELLECIRKSIPLIRRADMLAELMKFKKSIAVAGSHGKTTTTSLVGFMFDHANFDPTIVNGGIINSYSKNNRFGKGDWMIVEADESDGSFLRLPHQINIITNIDSEHLDYYKSKKNIELAFIAFINNLPFYGYSIICIDNNNLEKISKKIKTRKLITYSMYKDSDIKIISIKRRVNGTKFSLHFKNGVINNMEGVYNFTTTLMGDHNILNATAAISASLIATVPIKKISNSLKLFEGVKRRFSYLGNINKALIYDDYAHHPSEITASYQIAKQLSRKKIIIIFQPHRYSRTKILLNEFIRVFKKIEILYVLDIYPAGEKPIKNINSKNLVNKINKHKNIFYLNKKQNLKLILEPYCNEDNTIVFMGAGSITLMAQNLFSK